MKDDSSLGLLGTHNDTDHLQVEAWAGHVYSIDHLLFTTLFIQPTSEKLQGIMLHVTKHNQHYPNP